MATDNGNSTKLGVLLWVIQGLLAATFLFAGGMKLVVPIETLTEQIPLPALIVRAIGTVEVLGALGLILPGVLGIRPNLTPLAALGLLIVMSGASGLALAGADLSAGLIPCVIGILAAFVAYGRWQLVPHRASAAQRQLVLRPMS